MENWAEDLKKYKLPKREGVLVVVTGDLEIKTILHEAKVWRGFANKVEEQLQSVEPSIEYIETQKENQEEIPGKKTLTTSHRAIPIITILTLLLIIVIVLTAIWVGSQKPGQNLTPKQDQLQTKPEAKSQTKDIQPEQEQQKSEHSKEVMLTIFFGS